MPHVTPQELIELREREATLLRAFTGQLAKALKQLGAKVDSGDVRFGDVVQGLRLLGDRLDRAVPLEEPDQLRQGDVLSSPTPLRGLKLRHAE